MGVLSLIGSLPGNLLGKAEGLLSFELLVGVDLLTEVVREHLNHVVLFAVVFKVFSFEDFDAMHIYRLKLLLRAYFFCRCCSCPCSSPPASFSFSDSGSSGLASTCSLVASIGRAVAFASTAKPGSSCPFCKAAPAAVFACCR